MGGANVYSEDREGALTLIQISSTFLSYSSMDVN